jgi:hypothetical protein
MSESQRPGRGQESKSLRVSQVAIALGTVLASVGIGLITTHLPKGPSPSGSGGTGTSYVIANPTAGPPGSKATRSPHTVTVTATPSAAAPVAQPAPSTLQVAGAVASAPPVPR